VHETEEITRSDRPGGCGEGYRVDPACLNVTGITDESRVRLLASVSRFLKREGFEELGKYEETIALIQPRRN
jgi:hypothetical protein